MSELITGAREDVLDFYKTLPFNSTEKPEIAAELIKKSDNVAYVYPNKDDLYNAGSVLEIGCGAGWMSNSLAYYYGLDVTAIDFNPLVIEKAKKTSEILGINVKFECADLFKFKCKPKDLVISIGVLHHTSDCLRGVRKCIELTKYGGGGIYRPLSQICA